MNNNFRNKIFLSILLSIILVTSVLLVSLPTADAVPRTVIRTIPPVAVSTAFSGWTAVDGTTVCAVSISNPSCNDEKLAAVTDPLPPNDAKYVKSLLNNDRLTFVPASIPDAVSVNYFKIITYVKKPTTATQLTKFSITAAMGSSFNSLPKGGTALNSVYDSNLSTAALDAFTRTMTKNPFTNAPWTPQEVKDWTVGIGGPQLSFGIEQNTDAKEVRDTWVAYEASIQVNPKVYIDSVSGVSPTAPRWGLDSITVSGHTDGGIDGDKIIIEWGDGSSNTVTLSGNAYTSPSHTYATAGDKTITVKFTDSALTTPPFDTTSTIVNVKKHATSLTIGSHGTQPWGALFTIRGVLTDLETGGGVSGESIRFSGTGVGSLTSVLTEVDGSYSSSGNAPGTVGSWTLFANHDESSQYLASNTPSDPYDTRQHFTTLTLNLKPSGNIVAGNDFTAFGLLSDDDDGGKGLIDKTVALSSDNGGAVNLPTSAMTSVTVIEDAAGIIIEDCNNCPPGENIMRLHEGAVITLPENSPVGRFVMISDTGETQVKVKATPGGSGTAFEKSADLFDDELTALTLADVTGILRVEIVDITGSDTVGFLQLQTASSADDVIFANINFRTQPAQTASTLTFAGGGYFADLTSPSAATIDDLQNGLAITASFGGDTLFASAGPITQTYDQQLDLGGAGAAVTVTADSGIGVTSVVCATDTDGDSLCNAWESTGINYKVNGVNYKYLLPGVISGTKDIYLELDAMDFHTPRIGSIDDMVAVFAANGITLHVLTDETTLTHVDVLHVWTDADADRTNDFDCLKADHFATAAQRPSLGLGSVTTGIAPGTSSATQTITVTGITLTTPLDARTSPVDQTEGTITIKANVTLGSSATSISSATVSSPSPVSSLVITGPTASVSPTAVANVKTVKATIPFRTTSAIGAVTVGPVVVTLNLSAADTASVVLNGCTPTARSTLQDTLAQAYHYGIYGHTIAGHASGQAEQRGNDLVVTLGEGWQGGSGGAGHTGSVGSRTEQSGTLMHELGHNLNLGHGSPFYAQGDPLETPLAEANMNCKPNKASVMSYSMQVPTGLLGGTYWRLNYSLGIFPLLDETNLNEGAGLVSSSTAAPKIIWGTPTVGAATFLTGPSTPAGGAVTALNWDGDASGSEASVSADINDFGFYGCQATPNELYHDYNEWTNLEFNFRKGATGQFDGHHGPPNAEQNDDSICQIKWGSDFTTASLSPFINFEGTSVAVDSVSFKFQAFDEGEPFGCGTVTAALTSDGLNFTPLTVNYDTTTQQYESDFTAPAVPGTYYIRVTIDPPGDLTPSFTLVDPANPFSIGGTTVTAKLTVNSILSFFISPIDNRNYNEKSTLPVKLTVTNALGAPIPNQNVFVYLDGNVAISNTESGNLMILDPTTGQYIYHLTFPAGTNTSNPHTIRVELAFAVPGSQPVTITVS